EITHADRADLPRLQGRLDRAPRSVHVAEGLMDQVEVAVLHPEAAERLLDGLPLPLVAGVLHPQLRRADSSADRLLVEVRSGRVDQAVAGSDRVEHAAFAFLRIRNLKDAAAQFSVSPLDARLLPEQIHWMWKGSCKNADVRALMMQ